MPVWLASLQPSQPGFYSRPPPRVLSITGGTPTCNVGPLRCRVAVRWRGAARGGHAAFSLLKWRKLTVWAEPWKRLFIRRKRVEFKFVFVMGSDAKRRGLKSQCHAHVHTVVVHISKRKQQVRNKSNPPCWQSVDAGCAWCMDKNELFWRPVVMQQRLLYCISITGLPPQPHRSGRAAREEINKRCSDYSLLAATIIYVGHYLLLQEIVGERKTKRVPSSTNNFPTVQC